METPQEFLAEAKRVVREGGDSVGNQRAVACALIVIAEKLINANHD